MPNTLNNQSTTTAPIEVAKRGQSAEIISRFMKNKTAVLGLGIALILVFAALFPQILTPYNPIKQSLLETFLPPGGAHPFGTDEFGRDIFARIVYGTQTSLKIGIASVSLACLVGVILGSISGYYGGITDNILMRAIDVIMAIPNTMLGISIMAALGQSVNNLILALGIGMIPAFARLTRISVQSVKGKEFVEAAVATGANDFRIITKYILPNCTAPIIVQFTMGIAVNIMAATGLSFLGLGVPAPTPEWGAMASSARAFIRDYWWMVTFPGLAIMATAFSFNLFGDGLRDALDPKLKN